MHVEYMKGVRMNKKGMSALILVGIILALVIFVAFVFGFSGVFEDLFGARDNFSAKKLQQKVSSCNVQCISNQKTDYCKVIDIYTEKNQKEPANLNCEQIAKLSNAGDAKCSTITCLDTEEKEGEDKVLVYTILSGACIEVVKNTLAESVKSYEKKEDCEKAIPKPPTS
jgi:hypothetical protein